MKITSKIIALSFFIALAVVINPMPAVAGNGQGNSGAQANCGCGNPMPPAPTLTVIKEVINDNGQTKVASDFTIHVKQQGGADVVGSPFAGAATPGTLLNLTSGMYTVSEDFDSLYTASFSGDCDASGNVSLVAGDNKICTITNNDIPPIVTPPSTTLTIVKNVINDNGGTLLSSNFTLHLLQAGVDVTGSPFAGAINPGTLFNVTNGTYTVSEDYNSLYAASFSGDCDSSGNVSLASGDNKICTITNNDIGGLPPQPQPSTLTVIKTVINDNGQTKVASDFTIHVKQQGGADVVGSPFAGAVTPGTLLNLSTGPYTVSEDADSLYTASFSGDCDASGNVSLVAGDHKICTITNNDIGGGAQPPASTLTVIKEVINDNGQTKVASNFTIHVKQGTVEVTGSPFAGSTTGTLLNLGTGAYTVSEDSDSLYSTSFSGACDASGNVSLTPGDNKICTITNNDIGGGGGGGGGGGSPVPAIKVVKEASTSKLYGGGYVAYRYLVTNPGPYALDDITISDDKCSPLVRLSGDDNSNNVLEVTESWLYQCETNLSVTTTNIVTVTGTANGSTVSATATATVEVVLLNHPNTGVDPTTSATTETDSNASAGMNPNVGVYSSENWQQNYDFIMVSIVLSLLFIFIVFLLSGKANIKRIFAKISNVASSAMTPLRLKLFLLLIISLVFLGFQLEWSYSESAQIVENQGNYIASLFSKPTANQAPSMLLIPSLNVNARIIGVGLTSYGAIGVPNNPNDVGWFNLGPKPGEQGTSVIVGHYGKWKDGSSSVFEDLNKLNPGDKISVKDSNGKTLTFAVKEIRVYSKDDQSNEAFRQTKNSTLNIITCNGDWISAQKTYTKRLVVFTELVS